MIIQACWNAYVLYPLAEWWQGRDISSRVRALRKRHALSWTERRQLAQQGLAQSVQAAAAHVPYYRDMFHKIEFDPASLSRDEKYLQKIPFLTKEILREQGPRLIDERWANQPLHQRKTGGSTGPSAVIQYGAEALDHTAAIARLVLEWTGKKRHHREYHLSSRFPEKIPWKPRLREWIKCTALNRWNGCTDAVDEPGLQRLWQSLRRVRPFLLQGHPSTVFALAMHLQRNRQAVPNIVQAFESAGETLTDKQRIAIETTLGCRVFNRYGNAEFGVVAHQTVPQSGQGLRVLETVAWPESIPGDQGHELVLTGLLNPAMPLLRYRTGDLAQVVEQEDGFYLPNVHGRIHDVVTFNGRRYPTHYLQDVLDRLGVIDEFQCQQLTGDRLLLRLAVAAAADRTVIVHTLGQWWGDTVEIEFTDLTGMQLQGRHSKFRHLLGAA